MNFERLKQELSSELLDDSKERYEFTWPDKRKAILNAITPTNKTLRPNREESKDFDTTQNLYIEGDNLEVLKLLQKTYLGKVKMIYIDPPYNTGNDFIYQDNFKQSQDDYNEQSSDYDDDGNRLVSNPSSNGRFHTDWLNMIYPRLKLARDLLTDDGVIFISIDDNEQANLKKVCDEIFGECNHIASFIVASNSSKNNSKLVSVSHEYLICFAKNISSLLTPWKVKKNGVDEYRKRAQQLVERGLNSDQIHSELLELVKYPRFYELDHFTYADSRGIYQTNDPGGVPNGNFKTEIFHPITGKKCSKPVGGWRYKEEEIQRKIKNNEFEFGEDETIIPRPKRYLDDFEFSVPKSLIFFDSQSSTKWLKSEHLPFDFPKAIELLKWLVSTYPSNDFLILDFFSGSATTAHAVMKLNAEDGGNRKFIMVQLPEVCAETSEAYKAGYKNICEIGKERIRRAGQKIKDESPLTTQNLDVGFRVLKVDSSNMKDVFYKPNEVTGDIFDNAINNIKEDRTGEDLLFQVLLDMGISLSSKIEKKKIKNKEVFYVYAEDEKFLIASFDRTLNDDVVTEIAKEKPQYFVMRDTDDDKVRINFEQIFKAYSPDTTRKVL